MNESKFLQLKQEIEKIPGIKRGYKIDSSSMIPKVYRADNPLVDTLINSLKLKEYLFGEIFSNKDMRTFIPTELQIKSSKLESLIEAPAFIFKNKYGHTFLTYCGKLLNPIYIWELYNESEPKEEPASEAEGEEGAPDEGGEEMDLGF